LDDAAVVSLADHLERARAVTARVAEPAAESFAEPARLADVEQAPVLTEQVIDAGGRGQAGETLPRHVHDERTPVAGGVLQGKEGTHAEHPALRRPFEEHAQDLVAE